MTGNTDHTVAVSTTENSLKAVLAGPFRRKKGVAALTAVLLLGGCSSVPDAMNPVEWYKSTVELFDDEQAQSDQGEPQAGLPADSEGKAAAEAKAAEFPSVNQVPEAQGTMSAAEQERVREGLIADREQRRYASAPIQRQDEDSAGTVTTTVGATQPPPPAMPSVPVAPAPVASAPTPPSAPTSVADTYKNRLNQKFQPSATVADAMPMDPPATTMPSPPSALSDIPAPTLPANATLPVIQDPLATVVISSDGVISHGSQISAQPAPQTASAGDTSASASAAAMVTNTPTPSYDQGTVKVATILFGNGDARLTNDDIEILRQVSRILKERGGRLRVVGHASSRTRNMDLVRHKMVNFEVSASRADRVARALVKIGVAPELISVVARSDAEPIYYEIMPSGEAGNRRAEIYLDS